MVMFAPAALVPLLCAVDIREDGMHARMQILPLQNAKLRVPPGVKYAMLEAGCSDMDTIVQDVLPRHPEALTLSMEPLLDKYSYLLRNASAAYHGINGVDLAVPLGHASRHAVVLPLAVSEHGGTQTLHVSPIAGCSSLAKVNKAGTWANARCRSVMETRLVDSIRLVDAIALVPTDLLILRLKLDVQGVDFQILKSVPAAVLQSRIAFIDVEVRKPGCRPLYDGQEDCNEVLEYMRRLDFAMVLPAPHGTSHELAGCHELPYDNACEANAHFASRQTREAASLLPLPYVTARKKFRGLPLVGEEHGRRQRRLSQTPGVAGIPDAEDASMDLTPSGASSPHGRALSNTGLGVPPTPIPFEPPTTTTTTTTTSSSSGGNGRTLIAFLYHESSRRQHAVSQQRTNLAFFMEHGVKPALANRDYHFALVLTAPCVTPRLPTGTGRLTVHDLNGSHGFEFINFKRFLTTRWCGGHGPSACTRPCLPGEVPTVDAAAFDRFVLLPDTVRGPFLPNYVPRTSWPDLLTSMLSADVKLVGPSINCHSCQKRLCSCLGTCPGELHSEGHLMATDAIGLRVLLNFWRRPAHKGEAIGRNEMGMTGKLLQAGHNIASLELYWRGHDFRDGVRTRQKCAALQQRALVDLGGLVSCPHGCYWGHTPLSPLEILFVHRSISYDKARKVEVGATPDYTALLAEVAALSQERNDSSTGSSSDPHNMMPLAAKMGRMCQPWCAR